MVALRLGRDRRSDRVRRLFLGPATSSRTGFRLCSAGRHPAGAATVEQVAADLAWCGSVLSDYDLTIVGAGPAGLAAAVYAASEGCDTGGGGRGAGRPGRVPPP